MLEALSILNGYKVSNHICYVAFLREIMDMEKNADQFNSFRKLRNGLNYYGEDITTCNAMIVIKEMDDLLIVLKDVVKRILDKK